MSKQTPVIICGPTASGKSDYALEYARQHNGVIINGDSMQVYRELPILTAQPSHQDQVEVPHRLYGILAGDDPCSVARWRDLALQEIECCQENGFLPIIVGGTGLYLDSLINGLTEIPDIDPLIRQQTRDLYQEIGAEAFHAKLSSIDPEMASRLNQKDRHRSMRAYEVMRSTGKSLAYWHQQGQMGIQCKVIKIERSREDLHQRAAARFDKMIGLGALDEVEALLKKNCNPTLSIMQALGVFELSAYLGQACTLEEAKERAIIATRQYIKRQSTWFRHQLSEAETVIFSGNTICTAPTVVETRQPR